MHDIVVRPLAPGDVSALAKAFGGGPVFNKPASQYERYLREHEAGIREVLLAFAGGEVAGYLTIRWEPDYPPFRDGGIPEVQDLNVLVPFRRMRVASALMDEAERRIAERSEVAGIGVGMDPDYGNAQRMYVRRGYIPDGRGLTSHDRHLKWGEMVRVDDHLVLFLTKHVAERRAEGPPVGYAPSAEP